MRRESSIRSWEEGSVNRLGEHFELRYGPYDPQSDEGWADWLPVALIGPPVDGVATVEFLLDQTDTRFEVQFAAARQEIELYLIEPGHEDAWGYAKYHACSTLANFYSTVHWGYVMPRLEKHVGDFLSALEDNPGFAKLSFSVGELRADSNWPWGKAHGVYCFVVDDEVVYVGRALGKTLGERLWDQLRSTSDPKWEPVVTRDENRVEVFSVPREWAFLGAALEPYLIDKLKPRLNSRVG